MPAADPPAVADADAAAAPDQAPPPPQPPPHPLSLASAIPFWFYLAAAVSLLALLLPHFLPPSSHAPPLQPPLLRGHLASGRFLKLDPFPGLFAATSRPAGGPPAHRVLILPGLAAGSFSFRRVLPALSSRGILAAVLDLPGQGLSATPPAAAAPARASALREIMDRGVFHAFEHLVQTGEVPYQEPAGVGAPPPSSPYAPAEAAAAVARALEALGVAPVHLVLHDSALAAGASFASANPGAVRSVTLVDATASLPAFPAAVFDVPVLGRLVLRVPALFRGLVRLCCARGIGAEEAEAQRAAMRGEGRTEGVIEAWKAMNHSFQLGEWRGSSEEVRRLPMMVLWSGSWSDMWIDEGKKVAAALPDAKFIYHSGGRWPQEDAAEEISELIADFVTSSEEAEGGRIEQPVV
ncbi:protein AUXIN RESPONSE 4-like [Phragmites australis]|uniref:protein AUXIN RESPONSE 4-like n=1 Tax=Phragmites australis TaxID=29695 RepID=UPI002D77C0A0|nr:protein AUXIN RESPONSE 4-like [Phragmites australis]